MLKTGNGDAEANPGENLHFVCQLNDSPFYKTSIVMSTLRKNNNEKLNISGVSPENINVYHPLIKKTLEQENEKLVCFFFTHFRTLLITLQANYNTFQII